MPGNGQRKTACGVNTMERSERKRETGTMREKPLGTKGALLYIFCRHVVRSVRLQAQTYECLGFLRHWHSGQGFPLRRFAAIPNNKHEKEKLK